MMLTRRSTGTPLGRWLGRLRRPLAAPIELCAQRYGFLPVRFRHRGALHRVARIERIWEERGRGARADRRYFVVSCADTRRCTLFQELRAGTWHVVW
ncbi:MAG: hypothetical protein HGA45_05270 [Chloroflexales bacterium]|nr:hypothetical protein [Chloroflexales bacterium]